jgi:hypothetical protein
MAFLCTSAESRIKVKLSFSRVKNCLNILEGIPLLFFGVIIRIVGLTHLKYKTDSNKLGTFKNQDSNYNAFDA